MYIKMTSCTCTVFPACNHAKASSSQGKHNLLLRQERFIVKEVANKATEQEAASLEEFRKEYPNDVCKLKVKEHHPTYRNMNRNYPGSIFLVGKHVHIMQGIAGSKDEKATTYKDSNANSITASKCKFVAKNSGILFV